MADTQPTGEASASVSERIERYLSAGEEREEQPGAEQQSAPEEQEAPQDEVDASDGESEDEGPQISLSDAAKILGVDESVLDVDDDGTIKVRTKIDGQEGAAKFQDLVKSYQLQGHVDLKARQAAENEKALMARVQQFESFAQAESQRLNVLANAAYQALMRDSAQINWDELNREDPVAYLQKRHEFEQRQAQVQGIVNEANRQQQQYQQLAEQRSFHMLHSEASRLTEMVSEWKNPEVRNKEVVEMRDWLTSKGVSPQSIAGLVDAGMVAALRIGMLAERNAPKVDATTKKVRAAPKLVKPGHGTDAQQRGADNVRTLKENIRKSGGKRGIAEYLMATGKV